MPKFYYSFFSLFLFTNLLLSGCASKPENSSIKSTHKNFYSAEQRAEQLLATKKWRLQGKIAFIQQTVHSSGKDKRESASMAWHVDEQAKTQELNLTSYLGINVLHLKSMQNEHVIEVDGKKYHASNLSQLIYSLTGFTLPTKALTYWLKGLPYKEGDTLIIDKKTKLPISLSSNYLNTLWQINYDNYQIFNGVNFKGLRMATKFTLKKNNLLIKIAVNKWIFDD